METAPKRPLWQALGLAWQLGWMIVLPLVFFALAGRYADQAFGTTPWLFLGGVVVAITSTTLLLISKFSRLIRDINGRSQPK